MTATRHLPNAITVLRLVCVPATVWLVLQANFTAAFWLFLGASATDAIDGILARLLGAKTALGSYLDALADKVLLASVYVALAFIGLIWWWLAALAVCRDVLLIAFAAWMHFAGLQSRVVPLPVSKVNTFAQILLVVVVLGHQAVSYVPSGPVPSLSWFVALTTTLSGIAYFVAWRRQMALLGHRQTRK